MIPKHLLRNNLFAAALMACACVYSPLSAADSRPAEGGFVAGKGHILLNGDKFVV